MIEPAEQASGPGTTNRIRVISSLVMAVLILLFSFYTELAGMRILEPEIPLQKALSAQFIISLS